MLRLLFSVLLFATLAISAHAVWKDEQLRAAAWNKTLVVLDDLLGVKRPPPARPLPEPKPAAPRPKATPKPVLAQPVAPGKPVAPTYVDRAPVPSAVERVRPEDKQRLDSIIAGKPPRTDGVQQHPGAARL